jgi:hypothetical protein
MTGDKGKQLRATARQASQAAVPVPWSEKAADLYDLVFDGGAWKGEKKLAHET